MNTGIRTVAVAATLVACLAVGLAKGPKKDKSGIDDPSPVAPATPKLNLPADLNTASLRVQAIDEIYQLDLTAPQLNALRTAAGGVASLQKRTVAPANAKIADALSKFGEALLSGADDDDVAKFRNDLEELTSDDSSNLDDDIDVTPASRPKASAFAKQLDAGQIAAYLASHADEVNDPATSMLSTLRSLRDTDDAADADSQAQDAADDVGWLAAGPDATAAAAVTAKAVDWFKANRDLTVDQQTAKHDTLEASAKKVIGDVPPMDVLSHWMDNALAALLSNPQLPQAVDAVLAAKEHE